MAQRGSDPEYFQDGPRLGNQWDGDVVLRRTLERLTPPELHAELVSGLPALGQRAAGDIARLGDQAEAQPPRLVAFDPWGRRIDCIEVSRGWRRLHAIAAEEGLVATPYERAHGAWSRLRQLAAIHLFHPSSAVATCPLAMTDGAAKVLSEHADEGVRARILPRLTSRDPRTFWTSGQWMTERAGGSDVSRTGTVACPGEPFRLHGTKWFTSATTSEIALTLARVEGDAEGSRGLSLFLIETRDEDGGLRGIRILRLKDKLGTRALPTAELELDGAPASLIGERGRGVATIASMLNITRLWNAACAVASIRRGLALAGDYARCREAFGRALSEHPLHVATLADLQAEYEAAFQLVARCFMLLGREEAGEASAEERSALRLLTPLAKLWTGKLTVAHASEILECVGGAGYIEDTGLPRLLRDAQVLPIWEGTTNVLSLDVLRVLGREESFAQLRADLERRLDGVQDEGALREPAVALATVLGDLGRWHATHREENERLEAGARDFALRLARAAAGVHLLEQAAWEAARGDGGRATAAAARFVLRAFQRPGCEPAPDPGVDRLLFAATASSVGD
ncbi:MAG: acyl-CoA dehydrogenase family protein [Thermoanaerobaculia bacterium]